MPGVVKAGDYSCAVESVKLPKILSENVMRGRAGSVVPFAKRDGFRVRAFLPEPAGSNMRGFRVTGAAYPARQRSDPVQIRGILRYSAGAADWLTGAFPERLATP